MNRVVLQTGEITYINANFIPGPTGKINKQTNKQKQRIEPISEIF